MVAKSAETKVKNGLLPTPAMQKGLPKAALTDNARQVLMKRYVRRGDDGKPAENVEDMFWRVAYHVAKVEEQWGADVQKRTVEYYHLLSSKKFFPNSPTFTGAGTPLGQLAACFTAAMRVTTDQGVKQIRQLQIGDRVLTHEGRYRPVMELFQRAYEGELLNIKIRLIGTTMEVTPEHPILTAKGWVKAGELKAGDKVAIGSPKGTRALPTFDLAASQYADELELQASEDSVRVRRPSDYQNSGRQAEWVNRAIELTPDLARLCGYYISEGTIGSDERYVRFTFAKDEIEYCRDVTNLVENVFGARVNRSDSSIGNWTNINVYSRPVVAWFRDHFWKGSAEKRLPVWLQYAEREIQEEFLVGVMRGDGLYFEKTYVTASRPNPKLFRSLRLTLSNPGLIQQIWQMCLRLGYDAAIRPVDTTYVTPNASDTAQIGMPPLQSRDLVEKAFGVVLPEPDMRYVRNKVTRDDDHVYFEIESIDSQYFNGVVYNCEVDEDHSYVTEGVIVHNCFVLPITDDMGRHSAGIFQTLRDAALIQQTGGGNGFSFSRLRPKGALVQTSAGQATGPVGFLKVYDHAFGEIAQGGCLLPDTLVFTDKGLLRLDEIVNSEISGWQEHQLSVPTDEGVKNSPRGYNNGVAEVLRVHTREGLGITGTPNHKIKVMTDNGPEWREIQDLAKGDWILVRLGEHTGKLQALKKPTQKHGNQVMPELPSILDEEFAFFLGYLAGDGFMARGEGDHRVGVSVAHSSYLMEEMPAMLNRLFNVNVHKMQKPNDRSVTFVMDNRAIKEFLSLNGLEKQGSRDVAVPRLIRQSPQNIVGAYLRGLFEADGTLTHGYPNLGISSARLAREVSTLLIGLGCPVQMRTTSAGLDRWGDSETYYIKITSTVGLQAWREKIGCDQRSRFVAAYSWESDLRRENSHVLPNPKYWLQPVLDEITVGQIDKKGRGRNINFRSTEPRLRRQVLRYLRDERNLIRSGYDLLKQENPEAFENAPSADGYWFVEVRGVEEAGRSLTLDLEVADNHTYLAYGMVTHNTRRGANMAVLRVDHPDVEDFITCKINENQITNFNISVGITDAFMQAVKDDKEWALRFPDLTEMKQKGFSGTLEQAEAAGITIHTYKKINARELFNKIVKQAHHNGEPGVLFLDAANRSNPVPHLYPLEATNPCFVGSTRIATDLGLLTIQELAESGTNFMVATDLRAPQGGSGSAGENFGVAFRASSPAWKTRENTLTLKITTKHGYSITSTPDHKFLTSDRGYVEANDLKQGDTLLLQSGEGVWSRNSELPNLEVMREKMTLTGRGGDHASGNTTVRSDFVAQYSNLPEYWSHEIGLVVGTLLGDGWLSPTSNSPVGMVFNYQSDELLNIVHQTMQTHFGDGHLHQRGSVRQLTYGRLPYLFFESLGVLHARAHEKRVPASIWSAPREAVVGFLQGLFTTDGTVNVSSHKKSCSIRLASASVEMLQEVQMLLLNFGIVTRIHKRRDDGYRNLPDGKGGVKEYFTHADYELLIDKANRDKFANEIGFIDSAKQNKVEEYIINKTRPSNTETFETSILSIEDAGFADVYDLTEIQTHSVIANGVVAHQCGEQWLGPYENCCLGSVNLNEHCGPDGSVDWESLRQSVVTSTRFLDDVVEANAYVPAVPQLTEAAHKARRIGLGIMGLADLMYHVGVRYGSPEGQEFGAQVMEFVRCHAMKTSIELAEERGPFPAIESSIYDMDDMKWQAPKALTKYQNNWNRPEVKWEAIIQGIKQHGIRNAAQTTVAPTGTIATVAGCEGYGCEPVFALAYIRHVNDNGKDLKLTYASPRFDEALKKLGLGEEKRQEIVERVMNDGTCQNITEIPQAVRDTFVVSSDITAEEHVLMQGALQAFVDNSLSKTVNFHENATEEDVARAYMMAWELGCKGITVYVTGSRDKVVLETKATADKKVVVEVGAERRSAPTENIWHDTKKPRPKALTGKTFSIETPVGKAFITINENGGTQPFEAFVNTAKAGSEIAAVSEAIGRLISYILRMASPIAPVDRMREIIVQLIGIGGGRSLGFGPNRVRSLPDGIGQVLDQYLNEKNGVVTEEVKPANGNGHEETSPVMKIGDICPECGEAAVVNEEGCRKCYACGFSEC